MAEHPKAKPTRGGYAVCPDRVADDYAFRT